MNSPEIHRRRIGALTLEDVPDADPAVDERWAQYSEIRSAAFADWAPGGQGPLILARFSQTPQIHPAGPSPTGSPTTRGADSERKTVSARIMRRLRCSCASASCAAGPAIRALYNLTAAKDSVHFGHGFASR